MLVISSEASDGGTDGAVDSACLVGQPEPLLNRWSRWGRLVAASACIAGACTVTVALSGGPGRGSTDGFMQATTNKFSQLFFSNLGNSLSSAVSTATTAVEQATSTYFVKSLYGWCGNAQQIQMPNQSIASKVGDCGTICKSTSGCEFFAFQAQDPTMCGNGTLGTCTLFKAGCNVTFSPCTDLYYITSPTNPDYAFQLVNSKALQEMNTGLEEARVSMNSDFPSLLNQTVSQQGYVVSEDGVTVRTMTGADSCQMATLQALHCQASPIAGKLDAAVIMRGGASEPLVAPQVTVGFPDIGLSMDFSVTITGAWVSATQMNAEIVEGPPMALTNMTVGPVGAGYTSVTGECVGDFPGCSDMLQFGINMGKDEMEKQIRLSVQEAMQQEFFMSLPIYPEITHGLCYTASRNCMENVQYAKNVEIYQNPSLYPGLTANSTWEAFQNFLYNTNANKSGCVPYCASRPTIEPIVPACYPPTGKCLTNTMWAKNLGINIHPSWYPGLTAQSSFEDFQNFLATNEANTSGCVAYCGPPTAQVPTDQYAAERRLKAERKTSGLSRMTSKTKFLRGVNLNRVFLSAISKTFKMKAAKVQSALAQLAKRKQRGS